MNEQTPLPSRIALRRVLIVLAVLVAVVIYAYGFKITDIGLEKTQEPVRQNSVQRALRELLSPDIFDQETTTETVEATFQKECSGQAVEQPARADGQPYIQLTPDCGERNSVVTVEGFGFANNSTGRIFLIRASGERQPFDLTNNPENTIFDIDGVGHFQTQITIPNLRGDAGSLHTIQVETQVPVGAPYFSATTQIVIEKMIETVFLALMATTIALPIAAFVSFLAARNLMKDVRIPLGNILVGVILLPVGWALGSLVLAQIGQAGLRFGKELLLGIILPAAAVAVFIPASRRVWAFKLKPNSLEARLRQLGMGILVLLLVLFVWGALGGIGIWLGVQFKEGLLGIIGNMLGVIGLLIELTLMPLSGLIAGLYIASFGMNLATPLLKRLQGMPSHALGGLLGALCGALIMAAMGVIGSLAALLTVIPPLVAAVMGGAALARFYEARIETQRRTQRSTNSLIVLLVGGALIFLVTARILDVLHLIVVGRLPSEDFISTSAIIGAVVGAFSGAVAGMNASFPIGDVAYNVTRTILNTLRSIEPLIMGIVFVIWVSVGPFAGVLALTLHSIASLGKLYSEQIESIDLGPLEAIQSTGANRLQTIVYAVVPQIVPPYIAFTMYRWDINVRMSTIIGFVGGGGIGFLLQQQINLLRYDQAGVAVLAIAIVVSVLDYASANLRERVV